MEHDSEFGDICSLGEGAEPYVLIFLHGLTSSGRASLPIAEYLRSRLGADQWRFILPTGRKIPVSVMNESLQTAWFDVKHSDFEMQPDTEGIKSAGEYVQEQMRSLIQHGTEAKHIFLGGFSQGGVIAQQAALTFEHEIGGLFILSSYLADVTTQSARWSGVPIFIGYGKNDEIVHSDLVIRMQSALRSLGHPIELKVYDMGHEMKSRELDALADWLERQSFG